MYYRSVVYRNVMRSVHKYLLFFLVLSVTPAYSGGDDNDLFKA
jgi:hypothetical protein